MTPFIEKYHQTRGTHCWFCDRQFGVDKCVMSHSGQPLRRTREHIIPKALIIYGYPKNYIASCIDCNGIKASKTSRGFAEKIQRLMVEYKNGGHQMTRFFPIMKDRAWKLYNKTSNLHKNYKKLRLNGKDKS